MRQAEKERIIREYVTANARHARKGLKRYWDQMTAEERSRIMTEKVQLRWARIPAAERSRIMKAAAKVRAANQKRRQSQSQ